VDKSLLDFFVSFFFGFFDSEEGLRPTLLRGLMLGSLASETVEDAGDAGCGDGQGAFLFGLATCFQKVYFKVFEQKNN